MPNQLLEVTDKQSGAQFSVEQDQYDPARHTLAEGQQIAVTTTDVALAPASFEAGALLGGPEIVRKLGGQERVGVEAEAVEEELYSGAGTKAGQFVRGGASALTFGLSEQALAAGDTSLEREVEQAKRRVGADYFAAGELLGDIAGSVVGVGAPGIAGRLAGKTLKQQAIRGAVDGGISTLSSAVGRQALSDEPMSASSLASQIGIGALVGGGGAALLGAAGRATRKLSGDQLAAAASKSTPDEFVDLLRRGEDAALGRAATQAGQKAAKATRQVKLSTLFSKRGKSPELTRAAASELLTGIQSRGGRAAAARAALADIEAGAGGAGVQLSDDMLVRARLALDDYDLAARAAGDAAPAIAKEASEAGAGAAVKTSREATVAVRALDQADRDLSTVFADLRASVPMPAAPAIATEAPSLLARGLDALGAFEIAGAGVAGMIPGVGPMLSGLAKVRTLYRAAGKGAATLRGTPTVAAAVGAARNSDRLTSIAKAVTGADRALDRLPGVRRGMVKASTITPAKVAALYSEIQVGVGDVAAAVDAAVPGLPPEVRSQAIAAAKGKLDYLQEVIPAPPPGLEHMQGQWLPPPTEAARFGEVHAALDDPFGAVGDVFAGRAQFSQAVVDAIRTVYPAVYQEVQASLVAGAAALIRNRPRPLVAQWARMWAVPLLPESQPSYRTPPTVASPQAQGPVIPPASAVSAVASGAERRRPGRPV